MERKAVENILVMAVLGALLVAGANGQSTCTNTLISLSPCLNFISGNATTPSSSCCTQLANVVGSQPQCLCQVLNGGASSLGITVNQTQALALPAACNVQTQPISLCNGGSPASSPARTPESPSTPARTPESPSTTVPSNPSSKNMSPTDSSAGSSIRSSCPLFTVLVLVASYASAS